MKNSNIYWLSGFGIALLLHFLIFLCVFYVKPKLLNDINVGSFDYPIKNDIFESIIMVSDLPIGELKQVMPNSISSSQKNRSEEQEKAKKQIQTIENIKSNIEHKKVEKKSTKKYKNQQKNIKEQITNDIKNENENKWKNDSNSLINSLSKDASSSAPVNMQSSRMSSNNIDGLSSKEKASWQSRVVSHLNKHKKYPIHSLSNHEEGIVLLRVEIDKSGNILFVEIKKPSKFLALNKESKEIFYRSSPLPSPPPELLNGNKLSLVFPIEFNIKKYKNSKKY